MKKLEEIKKGIIYKWTCKNGKVYIGQTIHPRKRKRDFLNFNLKYGGNRIFNARKKYNKPEFWTYEILEKCDINLLNDREEYYINLYNATDSKYGYNTVEKGNGSNGYRMSEEQRRKISIANKGRKWSEESKKKLSNKKKGIKVSEEERERLRKIATGRKHTEEWKKMMSEKMSGENNPNRGRKATPEQIEKMRNARLGKKLKKETILKKIEKQLIPIYQIDIESGKIIKEWSSTKEVVETLYLKGNSISQCLNGKSKSSYGFFWIKKKDYKENMIIPKAKKDRKPLTEERKRNISMGNKNSLKRKVYAKKQRKPIYQFDMDGNFIKEWESITQASKELKISMGGIIDQIKGKHKHTHNFVFKYAS